MNFRRKSTVGWSIGNILLDLVGGLLNFGQMSVQSIDQRTFHFRTWIVLFNLCITFNLHKQTNFMQIP